MTKHSVLALEFNKISDDVWGKLEECRYKTKDNPLIKWVLLKEKESISGELGGIQISKRGLFLNSEFASIVISYSWYKSNYFSIQSWAKRHMPVDIFTNGEAIDYEDSLQNVIDKMTEITERLNSIDESDKLDSDFPKEWIGKSIRETIIEQYIKPNQRWILNFLMVIGFIIPFTLAIGISIPITASFFLMVNFGILSGLVGLIMARWFELLPKSNITTIKAMFYLYILTMIPMLIFIDYMLMPEILNNLSEFLNEMYLMVINRW